MKGLFITFEGPDGAGKTTQVRLLADALASLGKTVVLTREPGGTRIGDQIRGLLLAPDHTEMDARTEVLLYAAQRAQNVAERILPALAQGHIVIGDRFTDASMAYQSAGLGIDEAFVRQVNEFATGGLKPHRTYMLDLPEDAGRRRLENRIRQAPGDQNGLDRIERRTDEYHRRVREAFRAIARREPERVLLLNAEQPPETLARIILEDCMRFLEAAGEPESPGSSS